MTALALATIETRNSDVIVLDPAPETGLSWQIAPGEESKLAVWIQCRDRWLRAKQRKSGGQNTVHAYTNDWNDFFTYFRDWQGQAADGTPTYGLMPWQVGRLHSEIWVESLSERGLAAATVVRKVSALSSFYDYAMHDYTIQVPGRGEQALWDHPNPFRVRDLPKVQQDPIFPTQSEIRAIFEQIDTRTITGLRNLAILFGMYSTTRRVTEWLSLKWGDIYESATGHYFRYRYKGGVIKKQAMPGDAYTLIANYLKAARRWPLGPEEYIFVAHSDSARAFGQVGDEYSPGNQPLSGSYAWALLQRYGKEAGVDPRKCHPHGLRHGGAHKRHELGADGITLQGTLGHASLAMTERYIRDVLDEPEDKYGDRIGDMLPRQYRLQFAA